LGSTNTETIDCAVSVVAIEIVNSI